MIKMNRENGSLFQYVWLWDKGEKQAENQDAIYIRNLWTRCGQCCVFCVCDGMGGFGYGKEAAAYTVRCIDEWMDMVFLPMLEKMCFRSVFRCSYSLRGFGFKQRKVLRNAGQMLFYDINKSLFGFGRKKGGFGTTMSMCILFGGRYFVFHVGDSALYTVRNGKRLTKKHSIEQDVLERCLGVNRDGRVDFLCGKCRRKEAFLMGSDGLFKRMEDNMIKSVFQKKQKDRGDKVYFKKRLEEVVAHNRRRGESDNISAVYVWR